MTREEVTQELKEFTQIAVNTRLENDLPVVKEQLINKVTRLLKLLNEENKTEYIINIETLVNSVLYKDVTRK